MNKVEHFESDTEFWEELEEVTPTQKPKLRAKPRPSRRLRAFTPAPLSTRRSTNSKQIYIEKIRQTRHIAQEEVKKQKIKVKQDVIEEVGDQVDILVGKNKKKLKKLNIEYQKLRDLHYRVSGEIAQKTANLKKLQVYITQQRIISTRLEPLSPVFAANSQALEQIRGYQFQIDDLKIITGMYKADLNEASNQINKHTGFMDEIRSRNQILLQAIGEKTLGKERDLRDRLDCLRSQLTEQRKTQNFELELKKAINQRSDEIIQKLESDIRASKTILNHTKLRQIYRQKAGIVSTRQIRRKKQRSRSTQMTEHIKSIEQTPIKPIFYSSRSYNLRDMPVRWKKLQKGLYYNSG